MVKLAFYKGDGDWFDKITKWRTAGDYTHVEIVFTASGMSFSSSQRDGGTRFKNIDYSSGDKWDVVLVPGAPDKEVEKWCKEQQGKKYDWRGILGIFTFGKYKNNNNKWWCSEICRAAISQTSGIFGWLREDCDPDQLYIAAKSWQEAAREFAE